MAQYAEGQRLRGSDGKFYVWRNGVPVRESPTPLVQKPAAPFEAPQAQANLTRTQQEISQAEATASATTAKAKADALKAELEAKQAQEEWNAKHPKTAAAGTVFGPDYLKTLPGPDQELVKALAEGRLAFPGGFALKAPWWQQKLEQVAQYDPSFDATNFNNRAKARAALLTGKMGGSANALNTAIGHLGLLSQQIGGTASHDFVPLNAIENAAAQTFGSSGVTNFKDTAKKLADELESVYRNGGGTEQGVMRQLSSLNPNASLEQKQGIIKNALELLASKQAANLYQYGLAGGKPAVDLLDPAARKVLDQFPDIRDKYFGQSDPALTPAATALIQQNGGTPPSAPPDTPQIGPEQQAQFFQILQKQGPDAADAYLRQFGLAMTDKTAANRPYSQQLAMPDTYANSYLGQGLSGANEGLADVLGAPVDLARTAINLVPQGINAVANTNIPTLPPSFGSSQWWKSRLSDVGSILPPSGDTSKQFTRRVGESVGSAAVPGMFGGSLPKFGAALLSGLGSGVGGATAQQIAPGNPLAEFAGDTIGGGLTGLGILKGAQRSAQRQIEAAVPTVEELKGQASNLYRKAETNGVVATPEQTQQLAADVHGILREEGQLGPHGAITNADTNTSKAFNLIQQYAGKEMTPKEMNTVRTVLADSRKSADPADRRLGNLLLDHFDNWASPMAPEFDQARSVASRYLQAQDLERARELAEARASQFTGSGFENALRTEYRGLDRGNINGQNYFAPDVTDAIQTVARGTPVSNTLRGLGRLAPTGPVAGMGSVIPGLAAGGMFGGPTGAGVGTGLAGLGIAGRIGATRMGIRAADKAELIARNGGALDQAPLLPDDFQKLAAWLAAIQQSKYLNGH
jgi:hypothetical protein